MKTRIQIIVLAAGKGTRMNNKILPKVLLPLKSKPVISYLLKQIQKSQVCDQPVIVVNHQAGKIKQALGPGYVFAHQDQPLGTGHAVASCRELLKNKAKHIMVLYGDMPYLAAKSIQHLAKTHVDKKAIITMATVTVTDFEKWRKSFYRFGRIIRNKAGKIQKIIEFKDASQKQKLVKEVNPSYFCFQAKWLWKNISQLKNNNAQKEYYLTDLVKLAVQQKRKLTSINIDAKEALGINSEQELQLAKLMLNK